MSVETLVALIHIIAFLTFWVLLTVGATSTIARIAYYRAHGYKRPRLLVRDTIMLTGFALSFGLILFARVLDSTVLRNNVLWVLATDLPAVIATMTYVYFELFVIERGVDNLPPHVHIEDAPTERS